MSNKGIGTCLVLKRIVYKTHVASIFYLRVAVVDMTSDSILYKK